MSALTGERDTRAKAVRVFDMPVAANVTIFRGALVVVDSAGNARPGYVATGLIAAGRAETSSADNPGGPVRVSRGEAFAFGNSLSADAVTAADWGKTVYIVDDQTVARTDGGGTRSAAGVCRGVDRFGVWVQI